MNDTNKIIEPRRFLVIGVGGTGGWVLEGLARMAEFRMPGSAIIIVDGDEYEPRNAERQTFSSLGNKAIVKAQELSPYFPSTFITGDPRWVVEKSNSDVDDLTAMEVAASVLLQEEDVVYAMVDNHAARKVLFDAAQELDNIDVFTGGNDDQLFGSVYHYSRRDGENVTDHPADYHPNIKNPVGKNPGDMTCAERARIEGSTQTIAANMAVAAMLLGRTHKVIIEGREDLEAEIMFDLGEGLAQPYDRTSVKEEELVGSSS